MPDMDLRRLCRAIILWSLVSFAMGLGALLHVQRLVTGEIERAYSQAEITTVLAEQSWRVSYEAVGNALQLVLLRERMLEFGSVDGLAALDHTLRQITTNSPLGILGLSVADGLGNVVWSTVPGAMRISIAGRQYFQALFDGSGRERVSGQAQRSLVDDAWVVNIAQQVRDGENVLIGAAIVTVDPLVLSAELARLATRPGQTVTFSRVADGGVRASSHDAARAFESPPLPDQPVQQAARQAPNGRLRFASALDGRQVLVAYRVVAGLETMVATRFDLATETLPARRMGAVIFAGTMVAMLGGLALCLAWWQTRRLREQLVEHATRDPLTGLFNRRSMEAELAPVLRRAGGPPFALLLFDLDHFKAINDLHGHAAGDQVLRDVAGVLRGAVRRDDMVCRWGGEELLVVLVNCPVANARIRADALREAIAGRYEGGGGPVPRVTASVGVACFNGETDTLDAMVQTADAALYRAKAEGRNRVVMAEMPA